MLLINLLPSRTGRPDLTGKKFGKLTALKLVPLKQGQRPAWECVCDCGRYLRREEKFLAFDDLSKTKHGCRRCLDRILAASKKQLKQSGEQTWKLLMYRYITSANKKKIEFNLSEETFRSICSQNCHYCRMEPRVHNKYRLRKSGKIIMNVSSEAVMLADIYANGIDRVDSNKGYVASNCVPCCHVCNYAKQSLTEEEFFAHIKRIYEYRQLQNFRVTYSTINFSHIFDE